MARFIVANKSNYNIELLIPAPHGSRRNSACFILERSKAIDILPWAGSLENCRRIAHIRDLTVRGLVDIVEEE